MTFLDDCLYGRSQVLTFPRRELLQKAASYALLLFTSHRQSVVKLPTKYPVPPFHIGDQVASYWPVGNYDDNGNVIRKTLLATGTFTQYTYDPENRLNKVEEFAAGNPTPTTTSTYRYDGLGRRIEKVANGQTRRYVYDFEDILLEYDGTNTLLARYTH